MQIDNNFFLNTLLGISLVFCALLTGCGSGSSSGSQVAFLSIDEPASASSYTTQPGTVLAGTVSGATLVHVRNELTGYTTDAYVTYSSPGNGSWFTNSIGLGFGDNPITVTADPYGNGTMIVQKHITVTRPLQPAKLIINGPNQGSSSTYWSVVGNYKIALFGDGTGRSTTGAFSSGGAAGSVVDFTWSYLGPDAIVVTSCPDCSFQKITRISGSFNEKRCFGQIETLGTVQEPNSYQFSLSDGNL